MGKERKSKGSTRPSGKCRCNLVLDDHGALDLFEVLDLDNPLREGINLD